MGLPDALFGGPGGGGIGLPDALNGTASGDGRFGTSGPSALGRSGAAGFGGAVRSARAGGAPSGGRGAAAGAASSGRGRVGPLEPLEVTTRFGRAGGGPAGTGADGAAGGAAAAAAAGGATGGATGVAGAGAAGAGVATGAGATGGADAGGAGGLGRACGGRDAGADPGGGGVRRGGGFLVETTDAGASSALAGSGSSTIGSRRRPSRSALRRARSAWASSIEEEAVFTPIPSEEHRSSVSELVRPSSRASSCTRTFFCAKSAIVPSCSDVLGRRDNPEGWRLRRLGDCEPMTRGHGDRSLSQPRSVAAKTSSACLDRNDRLIARFRRASSMHSIDGQSHAPRPIPAPSTTISSSASSRTRTNSLCSAHRRQPTQVRSGRTEGHSSSSLDVAPVTTFSQSEDEIASPPPAGCQSCSPVSSSVIHSPSAQSISA